MSVSYLPSHDSRICQVDTHIFSTQLIVVATTLTRFTFRGYTSSISAIRSRCRVLPQGHLYINALGSCLKNSFRAEAEKLGNSLSEVRKRGSKSIDSLRVKFIWSCWSWNAFMFIILAEIKSLRLLIANNSLTILIGFNLSK